MLIYPSRDLKHLTTDDPAIQIDHIAAEDIEDMITF